MSKPFVIGEGLRGSVARVWEKQEQKPSVGKIQLNINMGLAGSASSLAWLEQRYMVIRHLVGNNTDWKILRCGRSDRQVESITCDMLVMEHVFVAEIELGGYQYPTTDMLKFVHSMADVLGQGCIAVYEPARDNGYLVGSDCAPWGEFDSNNFVFIEEVPA